MTVCESHASLPSLVQRFFADWLIAQREASPHTVASYRDTFRLLLAYATRQLARQPTDLSVADIDADLVVGFLAFVEDDRNNSIRTRNVRRAAIRGFFRFVAMREPALLLHCQRVLAIPAKRQTKRTVDFLEREEAAALLAMPDLSTAIGRRDRNLLLVALQTGLRVSELIGLNIGDVVFGPSGQPHVRCRGKGRKNRATPLRGDSAKALAQWLPERAGASHEPLFASNRKRRFSRDGIERIVRKYTRLASATCPSLARKRVSPHTLRHTAAMELLQSGVGCTVIAPVAWPRVSGNDARLPARRHADQETGDGSDKAGGSAQGSLPARRRAVGVPQLPLTCFMPTIRPVRPSPSTTWVALSA